MRIIIAGAGEVGTHLAKLLSREDMEISLLDESPERLGDLSANYDMLTRVGNPTSIRDQREIGVKDCDLFISVTPHETENMTACLIANSLGAKRTLARIDNYEYLLPENRKFFENMGLNHLIYPEVLAANEIEESLRTNWMRYHLHLCQGALELCIVKVRETAKILGQSFASGVYNHGKYRIVAIKRDQQTIIPRGQDTVEVNDLVYCVCPKENMEYMREELGKSKREINNVIFFGGDRIARKAATELVDEMNIKIIERAGHQCRRIRYGYPQRRRHPGRGRFCSRDGQQRSEHLRLPGSQAFRRTQDHRRGGEPRLHSHGGRSGYRHCAEQKDHRRFIYLPDAAGRLRTRCT